MAAILKRETEQQEKERQKVRILGVLSSELGYYCVR